MIVYPFIDGDTSWTGMTNEQWKEVGAIFKRIHQVILPPFGFESLATRRPLIRRSMPGGYVPLKPNTSIRDMMEVKLRALFAQTGWHISPRFTQR